MLNADTETQRLQIEHAILGMAVWFLIGPVLLGQTDL